MKFETYLNEVKDDLDSKVKKIIKNSKLPLKKFRSNWGSYSEPGIKVNYDFLHIIIDLVDSEPSLHAEIENLKRNLTAANITFTISPTKDIFIDRKENSADFDITLSDEARDELLTGKYKIIGKSPNILKTDAQKAKIYQELADAKLATIKEGYVKRVFVSRIELTKLGEKTMYLLK